MLLRSGNGIVVEVVNRNRRAIAGQMKIELDQQRTDSAGCCRFAGEREENVAVLVHEIDDILGTQRGPES